MPHRSLFRLLVPAASAVVLLTLLAGCAVGDAPPRSAVHGTETSGSTSSARAQLGDGFLGDVTSPTPEATVTPEAGSWDDVAVPVGYRVIMITTGTDRATGTLTDAVTDWAKRQGVELNTLNASTDDEVEARALEATATSPDLVIGAGSGVIDVLALVTPQHLAQQFLVIGAELPEPTENVTSVVWDGATFRGTGLSASGDRDAASVTSQRAGDAIGAGVASVLSGLTGIVLRLSF